MAIAPIFKGTVTKGRFVADYAKEYALRLVHFEGKRVEVVVKREVKLRSLPQNRYYRGVVVELIAEKTGYTPDETHDMLRQMFLKVERDGLPPTIQSTTELSTEEFSKYVEDIKDWAAQFFGTETEPFYIPNPGDVDL